MSSLTPNGGDNKGWLVILITAKREAKFYNFTDEAEAEKCYADNAFNADLLQVVLAKVVRKAVIVKIPGIREPPPFGVA